jgi:hypothetical protein
MLSGWSVPVSFGSESAFFPSLIASCFFSIRRFTPQQGSTPPELFLMISNAEQGGESGTRQDVGIGSGSTGFICQMLLRTTAIELVREWLGFSCTGYLTFDRGVYCIPHACSGAMDLN